MGEVAAGFDGVYGASVSKDAISRITDKVIEEMTEWQNRPLDRVYPVVFIDALVVKVRDGQVRNKPFYIAVGVTVNGERDVLRIWAGDDQRDRVAQRPLPSRRQGTRALPRRRRRAEVSLSREPLT